MSHYVRDICVVGGCSNKQQYMGLRRGKKIYRTVCERHHDERCKRPIDAGLLALAKKVKEGRSK